MKKNKCLQIDEKIVEKAEELGFDVPKFCEKALKRGINALECTVPETLPTTK